MEFINDVLPIILYGLLSILVVFLIVFIYKMIITLNKANVILDDIYIKVKKLDSLFEVVDKGTDVLNLISSKVTNIVGTVLNIFKRKRKDDINE